MMLVWSVLNAVVTVCLSEGWVMSDIFLFHGGCHDCTMQLCKGELSNCVGCCYLEADWRLPSKNNYVKPEPTPEQAKAFRDSQLQMEKEREERRLMHKKMVSLAKGRMVVIK